MLKKLFLCLVLGTGIGNLSAQNLSGRLGVVPNDWLDFQGVPFFVELGVEWEPVYAIGIIAAVKYMDDSFEQNRAWNRPGIELNLQGRYYFDIEEFNDGPYIGLNVAGARYGNYIAVNTLDGCEDRYFHEYHKFSSFIGYKTPGRFGGDFYFGPSYRTIYFYQESSCSGEGLNTVSIRNKWLMDVGARLTYRF